MAYVKPSKDELRFAHLLLVNLHANLSNSYLILAIVAWMRSESGRNWRGFNPLNLRPGADDAKYRSGVRLAGHNGHFSVYASLEAGAKATANRLARLSYYTDMIAALRRGEKPTKYGDQAVDFLRALVVSKWDAGHYGLKGAELKDPNSIFKTTIYKVFSSLTGHPFTIPAEVAKTPKPPPPPRQPRSLRHTIPVREYIQPYAAETFYEGRLHPETALPDARLES